MAISWQLRVLRGNYGIYVAVTGCTWQPANKCYVDPVTALQTLVIATYNVDPVTATRSPCFNSSLQQKKPPYVAFTGQLYVQGFLAALTLPWHLQTQDWKLSLEDRTSMQVSWRTATNFPSLSKKKI